jgi:uncharacterized membrane protein YeaQ/YmgE (transglycosylase-associated protein family)
MAFELLTWVGFGAVLGLLSLWLSRFRQHWFETLVAGVGGAFAGGLLAHMALAEGLRIGDFEIVSLVSAMAGAAVTLGVHWVVRYRHHRLTHGR